MIVLRWHTVRGCIEWLRIRIAHWINPERHGLPTLGACTKAAALAVPLIAGGAAVYRWHHVGPVAPPAPYVRGPDADALPGPMWGGSYGGGYAQQDVGGLVGVLAGAGVAIGGGAGGYGDRWADRDAGHRGDQAPAVVHTYEARFDGQHVFQLLDDQPWVEVPQPPAVSRGLGTSIPEPASMLLLATTAVAAIGLRRRR